jgi:very-short-patch-repair endonuclease
MKRWTVEIEYAREQRKKATQEEKIMWDLLRDRKYSNLKFYRQYPIVVSSYDNRKEFYIADFYCHTLRLILEIDGEIHNKQTTYDQARDNTLNELGYKILRISNVQVASQIEDVFNLIACFINKIKPLS